ncbi:MAG: tetratricopeptide repeat protein [Saprospiraceae bacterium]
MKFLLSIVGVYFFVLCDVIAQNHNLIPTVERQIEDAKHDTIKIRLLIELVDSIYDEKIWPRYNERAYELGRRLAASEDAGIQNVGKIYFADAVSNQGFLRDNQGDYTGALLKYFEALKIREELDYKRGIASSYNNIGTVFQKQGDLNRALDYFQKSYEIRTQNNDRIGMAQSLNHIGELYKIKNEYEQALTYMKKSLALYEAEGRIVGGVEVKMNMCDIYILEGKFSLANEIIESSLQQLSRINNPKVYLDSKIRLVRIRIQQKHFDEAILLSGQALELAEKYHFLESKCFIYELLNQIYDLQGNTAKAYQYYKSYVNLKDSLSNPLIKNNALEQQLQYEYGKKEAEQLAEQIRKDTSDTYIRNTLIASCLVLFLFAAVLINRNYIRKIANEKLEEKNALIEREKQRAEESEQFKTQFLSNISHEIRTPMNAIYGMSNLLSATTNDEQQKNYIKAIQKSSENLLLILNDVLDLSKLEAGKVSLETIPFQVELVMRDVCDTLKYKAEEKGIGLHLGIDPQLKPYLMGDKLRLYQVLINLVGNAIKFTEKGFVAFELETMETSEIHQTLRYRVIDTGVGISPDNLLTIFDSFQQAADDTTRRFGGTGLGLSISQQLVKLRGSEIKVESELSKGSTFYFDIRYKIASEEDIKTNQSELSNNSSVYLQGISILLAEDNEYNQIVATESLKKHLDHCKISIADNGKAAIELLESGDFDIILLDINMPIMDGYETAKYIRNNLDNRHSKIPIIALTAFGLEDEQKYHEFGINGYLSKPFDINELIRLISKVLGAGTVIVRSMEGKTAIHSHPDSELLNLSFIRNFTENDVEQMAYFIRKFISNVPVEILLIQEAIARVDYDEIFKKIHVLKPQVEFVGISKALATIRILEQKAVEREDMEAICKEFDILKLNLFEGIDALEMVIGK